MKILIVTNRIPWPLKDGGALCMYQSIRGYEEAGIQTHLLAMNTSRHRVEGEIRDPVFQNLESFESVPIRNDISAVGALRNLFTSKSYVLERFESPEFKSRLIESIKSLKPDVVQFETLFTASYIPDIIDTFPDVKFVYRMHNIENQIWGTLASEETHPIRKRYYRLLHRRLLKEEIAILQNTPAVLPISVDDAEWVDNLIPNIKKRIYPFAINPQDFITKENTTINFYHLGSMDWQPNIDAMNWWLSDIWPKYTEAETHPFYMAGKNLKSEDYDTKNLQNVHILGEVEDLEEFLLDKRVLVVPLRSGSGMRIKIMEAMQRGILVLSTSLGLSGISGEDGKHFMIANTAEEFLESMRIISHDPQLVSEITSNARELILEKYNLSTEIKENINFFNW